MPRIARLRIAPGILVATVVGLFGCPQLLDDGFSRAQRSTPDAGEICLDESCTHPYASGGTGSDAASAGAGSTENAGAAGTSAGSGNSGASGSAGSGSSGASGSAGVAGNAGASGSNVGTAGASGTAGAGGTDGAADAGGSASQSGSAGTSGTSSGPPACLTLDITSRTQSASTNCAGIYGWDDIQVDTANSNVALSFNNGAPCFNGTIASTGWGATYEMMFANAANPDSPQVPGEVWNANSYSVTGFEFVSSGTTQPASLHIIYKDPSGTDFCKIIGPGDITVPFSAGHPNCSSTGGTVDTTQLSYLIFAFPVNNQPYNVNFCMQIKATQ